MANEMGQLQIDRFWGHSRRWKVNWKEKSPAGRFSTKREFSAWTANLHNSGECSVWHHDGTLSVKDWGQLSNLQEKSLDMGTGYMSIQLNIFHTHVPFCLFNVLFGL